MFTVAQDVCMVLVVRLDSHASGRVGGVQRGVSEFVGGLDWNKAVGGGIVCNKAQQKCVGCLVDPGHQHTNMIPTF